MLEKKVLDLLNQELDNTNSDKDQARIRRILEKKPEARKYLDDLQEMSLMFRRVNDVPPPSHLKSRILNALPFPKPARVVHSSPIRAFLREVQTGLRLRYAYAFAGGAVAGILLFALFTSQPADSENMAGTMGANQPAVLAEAGANVNLGEVSGTITAKQLASSIVVDLVLKADREVDVVLNFDPRSIRFDSFRPAENAVGTFAVLNGQLRITLSGQQTYRITMINSLEAPPPLTADILARGILLSGYELSFEKKINH